MSETKQLGWRMILIGLGIAVFAGLALCSPGRIDIIDGQARYETARSLHDHGDVIVRDPELWFPLAKGRDGHTYVAYRLPQPILGVVAIELAGPGEARRHFFYALISAFAGAVLAVAYAIAFRQQGLSERKAIVWAILGIIATPNWFYATSTFDDILGAMAVVLALVCVQKPTALRAAAAGLALGLAFNCKQPLGIFVLPVWAYLWQPDRSKSIVRMILTGAGLALGVFVYAAYEWYCFPGGLDKTAIEYSPPLWSKMMWVSWLAMLLSPSHGFVWYAPAALVGLAGLAVAPRLVARAMLLSLAVLFFVFASLAFGKGDICWGPRYLTPCIAALWLYAPQGYAKLHPLWGRGAIAAGIAVQLLAITADPHRLYARNGFQPGLIVYHPPFHFDLKTCHLLHRPAEIYEVLTSEAKPVKASPAPSATYSLPIPDGIVDEPDAVRHYHVFNGLRPYWAWQRALPAEERPVDLAAMTISLLALLALGAGAIVFTLRPRN